MNRKGFLYFDDVLFASGYMRHAFRYAAEKSYGCDDNGRLRVMSYHQPFLNKVAKMKSNEMTWSKIKSFERHDAHLALYMVIHLSEMGKYCGSDAQELAKRTAMIKNLCGTPKARLYKAVSLPLNELYITTVNGNNIVFHVACRIEPVFDILCSVIGKPNPKASTTLKEKFADDFDKSLKDENINSLDDFKANTLDAQLKYYLSKYSGVEREGMVSLLLRFYKKLHKMGISVFDGSITIKSLNSWRALKDITHTGIPQITNASGLMKFNFKNAIISYFINETVEKSDKRYPPELVKHFEESTRGCIIKDPDDLVLCKTFFRVADWYSANITNDDGVGIVIRFYRELCINHKELNFFPEGTMTVALLFNNQLSRYIKNGYKFVNYNPLAEAPNEKKLIVIIRGFDKYTSQKNKIDHVAYDFSYVTNDAIYHAFVSFIFSQPRYLISKALHFQLKPALEVLQKSGSFSVNYFIIKRISDELKKRTINYYDYFNTTERFLKWCDRMKYISLNKDDLEAFYEGKDRKKKNLELLDADSEKKLFLFLKERAMLSDEDFLNYAILVLMRTDTLRFSTILSLQTDCLSESLQAGRYFIACKVKNRIGGENIPVSKEVAHLLMKVIERTDSYRNNCPDESIRNKIFLHKTVLYGNIGQITRDSFTTWLKQACKMAEVPYFPLNALRRRRMTEIDDYYMSAKNIDELRTLTGHSRPDTSFDNYFDPRISEVLEMAYGIDIGKPLTDIDQHLLHTIPLNWDNSNLVENGTGRCDAAECSERGLLPCLVCAHFHTHAGFIPAFNAMIQKLDKQIEEARSDHDGNDLATIKQLCVQYLAKCYAITENHQN